MREMIMSLFVLFNFQKKSLKRDILRLFFIVVIN
jgi:hypothetical protein